MTGIPESLIKQCKAKLLSAREELMNRVKDGREELRVEETTGDEADQTVRIMQESEFLTLQERVRNQLLEIDMALARMANGRYGLCEETDEPIEAERLLAIPWTRLSIEGAEIRESMKKRYAK